VSLPVAMGGNRVPTARYRATRDWLEWTEGRLGQKSNRAPMWAVVEAEVRQTLQQRARRVGDVTVSFQHRDYTGSPTFVVLEDVETPKDACRAILGAARAARAARQSPDQS